MKIMRKLRGPKSDLKDDFYHYIGQDSKSEYERSQRRKIFAETTRGPKMNIEDRIAFDEIHKLMWEDGKRVVVSRQRKDGSLSHSLLTFGEAIKKAKDEFDHVLPAFWVQNPPLRLDVQSSIKNHENTYFYRVAQRTISGGEFTFKVIPKESQSHWKNKLKKPSPSLQKVSSHA